MIIQIPVGHAERHEVVFELNSFLENLRVTIDGELSIVHCQLLPFLPLKWVKRDGLAVHYRYSEPLFSRLIRYSFIVGCDELHRVKVEQETNFWTGPLRDERFRVYVDNRLIQEQVGEKLLRSETIPPAPIEKSANYPDREQLAETGSHPHSPRHAA